MNLLALDTLGPTETDREGTAVRALKEIHAELLEVVDTDAVGAFNV